MTLQCSPCFLVADCGGCASFRLSNSMIYKSGKSIGLWWIWSERAVILGPCRCHFGSKPLLIAGYLRPPSQQAEFCGPSGVTERHGERGYRRDVIGTSFHASCGADAVGSMLRHIDSYAGRASFADVNGGELNNSVPPWACFRADY